MHAKCTAYLTIMNRDMQQKTQEFATLTQGNHTIEQYATHFMELGIFSPHLFSIDRMQASKF